MEGNDCATVILCYPTPKLDWYIVAALNVPGQNNGEEKV